MIFKGQIKFISELQEGETEKGKWGKRNIVLLENSEQYPNEILLTLFKNGEHLDYVKDKFIYKVGDNVEVEYNTRVNEYKGKHYGDNSIWKITKEGVQDVAPSNQGGDEPGLLPF